MLLIVMRVSPLALVESSAEIESAISFTTRVPSVVNVTKMESGGIPTRGNLPMVAPLVYWTSTRTFEGKLIETLSPAGQTLYLVCPSNVQVTLFSSNPCGWLNGSSSWAIDGCANA